MPFDTVDDAEQWLDEEPDGSEVQQALVDEQDGPDRKTAVEAFQDYLENLTESEDESEDEPEEAPAESNMVEFRVVKRFAQNEPGDTVTMDANEPRTAAMRRSGHIRR